MVTAHEADHRNEVVGTAVGGALLGAMAGRALRSTALGATVGFVHGWITGRRRIYDWSSRRGRAAFVLDHSWALPTTAAGLVVLGITWLRERLSGVSAGYESSLSERQNRIVHRAGVVLRRGFAVTVGTVVNGAAGRDGQLTERRRKLVTDHEDVHVWQQRVFGPLYPIAYVGWFVGGVLVSVVRRALSRNDAELSTEIDRFAYYRNPFEWHAYTCDANWPPHGVDPQSVWAERFPISEWVPQPFRESAGTPAEPR
ncbi:MAG: hypothetical protein B7C54_05980 [Acidimicrobiales bacterium mtb01]|nr:MAG: hypothetical protein B7C54_05980 [Acidimicrobiales bacterium mtb01]